MNSSGGGGKEKETREKGRKEKERKKEEVGLESACADMEKYIYIVKGTAPGGLDEVKILKRTKRTKSPQSKGKKKTIVKSELASREN